MTKSDDLTVVRCSNEKCKKIIYKAGSELVGRVETKCRFCKHTFIITHKKK